MNSVIEPVSVLLVVFASVCCGKAPNIILIMADDMGYADAGCFGGQYIKTPHIDALAREGTRFTHCYAGSTVCAPSRSVLMTGQHTGHTRVRGNFGVGGVRGLAGGMGRVPLAKEDVTVAKVLKDAGYITGMTGKWGLGEPDTSGVPQRQGFDHWFGFLNQRRAHSYYPTFIWLNESRFALPGNEGERKQQYVHDLFTGFASNFIREHKDKPFFLYVPFTIPHSRFEIPDLGPYVDESWSDQEKTYAAMISRMDEHIGQLLSLLKELSLEEDTVVFFCSDNGAADRYDDLFKSSGPLRGRKRDMYEGGLRTPMVVRWPDRVPANAVNSTAWYFADFLPTVAEIAGATVPAKLDGVSVLPTLTGKVQPELADRFLYWEFFERGFQQAVRWRNWKAIRDGIDGELRLYDLDKDIGETSDVASENPTVVKRIEEYLLSARTESKAWPIKE